MNGTASYNGSSLNTYAVATRTGINVTKIDHTSLPDKVTSISPLADTDGNVASKPLYPQKRITLEGFIAGSSQADLDVRIDAFKAIFNQDGKNLDVNYGSGTRRYVAVLDSEPIPRRNVGLFATFSLNFTCQPFGSDTSASTLFTAAGHTLSVYNATPTVGGNAPTQLPIITVTVTALTGTGDYIQISNDLLNQTTLVYGLGLVAGDVVVFDSVKRIVTKNGVKVPVYGSFVTLKPGASSITYVDGFNTRTVTVAAQYTPQYL